MGNREDLLAGAKRCLFDKGYARTTARDITAASGVSLAAIGYHFGTKEALLNEALQQAIEEWGDELAETLSTSTDFETAWRRVIESFSASRPLWAIQFELLAHLERAPELRDAFAEANRQARIGLADLLRGLHPTAGEAEAVRIGAFYQVLLAGLAAVWMVDPDAVPSSDELLAAMRTIAT
ncbi:TetR/AcrR family transcriptional regulator [Phytohabitans aurantiacus]|jgi:AcrR family transcriptional regulator|uniref:TetR family transcriptional regulator n=1 Tax=Phytohabitans aurantiacus TaxID=3016789 RepID=A0ABQ5R7M7_9ACTN|nr:TetR/AcrR family transcriptional regulator [Phytohabitans aurantiacus]GLI01887.1 TetR family transcriptional regulator [Phytohabitans aurantiacus]